MKSILIIGGSYFAGRILVEELAKEDDVSITVFNRGRFPLNIQGVTELVGDRDSIEQIKRAIPHSTWDAVIDFCAYSPQNIESLVRNIPGNIGHYIFISTTTVYQQGTDLPVKEEAPKLEKTQQDLGAYADYGYEKWLAECALDRECKTSGIPYTILRPAIIYGPYNYAPRESYFFDLLIDKQPVIIPAGGMALFSFIYVVDMAQIIIRMIGDKKVFGEAYNLASTELVSYPRLVEVFSAITGRDIKAVAVPVSDIKRQGIPLPFPLDEHLVYSVDKIRDIVDIEYTPLIKGMHETLKYYLMVRKMQKQNQGGA